MAFGWGVANGADELQTCTTTCQAGKAGDEPGQITPRGVAVDNAGNVYVVDEESNRVQKFSSGGTFLLMIGGNVNKTTNGNVCTAVSGDVCGGGVPGSGNGEFEGWDAGNFIAIAPDDTVYVGDKGRIQIFNPDGTYKSQIDVAKETVNVGSIAIDPASGDIYYAYSQFLQQDPTVYKLTSSATPICSMEAAGPRALSTGIEGDVYVVSDAPGFGPPELEPIVVQFNSDCDSIATFGGPPKGTLLTSLAVNRIGDVYVGTFSSEEGKSYASIYGPTPTEIELAPEEAPTIASQFAALVSDNSAVLKAEINPHFFGSTTYYLEYGTQDCSAPASTCTVTPLPPGASLGGGERDANIATAGIPLSGLAQSTTYFFRFVATSGAFTTKGQGDAEDGPSGTFTTRRPAAPGLPDGRAYEKVSPAEKNHGEMAVPQSSTGGAVENGMVKPLQASSAGEAITFPSFAAFGDAQGAPAATQYLSRRTASGWQTRNITPAARGIPLRDPLRGFSEDLDIGVVVQHDPPLAEGATPGLENLYLQDDDTGALRLLTSEAPVLKVVPTDYCIGYFGASEGFNHVIFMALGGLAPDAPESDKPSLYEWTTGDGIRLVSVLPDQTPVTPTLDTGFGAGPGGGANCSVTEKITQHAISADGSRIFWTSGKKLYARIDGVETLQLDASQGGPGPSGSGRYWGASRDGSKVLFTDPGKLTSGAKGNDLYRYNFDAPEGEELENLTFAPAAADVLAVLGASEDTSHVYFAAKGALAEGATNGKFNLYLWIEGEGTRFITTLAGPADASNWGGSATDPSGALPERQTARVTPDGAHLAFLSIASLTGFDNTDQQNGKPAPQAFLYDAAGGTLSCASCNATGSRPLGPTFFIPWAAPFQQPRYLSDDGSHLFFESIDALAQADTNRKRDVYEFERPGVGSCTTLSPTYNSQANGCTELISSGRSEDDTYLLDASADGRDVFLSTQQKLLPSDADERYDVYDARSGGGFSPETGPPPPCSGEACRLPAPPPPAASPPPSSTFNGSGNVREHRKPKKKRHHKKKNQAKQNKSEGNGK